MGYKGRDSEEGAEMDELKRQLKLEARRHSNKLVKKLKQVVELPDFVIDGVHQEVLFATMDGYRATMKHNRNGDTHDKSKKETNGNY